jgi:nitroreductase
MELMDAICGRRAVRHYKADCPPEYQIRQLIDAAVWAPSAVNGQAWHFIVITRTDLLDDISAKAKSWILQNEPGLAQGDALKALLNDPDFHLLHHAPVLVIIAAPSKDKWSAEICAVAAQNLMLAATGHSLASCWIGLAQDWLNSPEGRKVVGLPDGDRVIAPIVVGYAAEKSPPVPRRRPAITWIGDVSRIVEDGEPAEPVPARGLFGGLVIPAPSV